MHNKCNAIASRRVRETLLLHVLTISIAFRKKSAGSENTALAFVEDIDCTKMHCNAQKRGRTSSVRDGQNTALAFISDINCVWQSWSTGSENAALAYITNVIISLIMYGTL